MSDEQDYQAWKEEQDYQAWKTKQNKQSGPVDFSAMEMVKNIPSSAGEFAGNIYHAVSNPVQTGKTVGKLALGSLDKVANALKERLPENVVSTVDKADEWLERTGIRNPDEARANQELASQVGQFYKDRYGSMDSAKQTLMSDPVGALADASAVIGGTGIAARTAGIPRAANITKVAAAMEPTNVAIKGATLPLKMIPKQLKTHYGHGISNLFPRHRKRAGIALNEVAGPDKQAIINALDNPRELIPGNAPTAGQAASRVGNREFASLDRLMEGRSPTPHGRAMEAQRVGRVQAIQNNIAKSPEEYQAAVNLRSTTTDPIYKAARNSRTPVDIKPVLYRIDNLINDNPGNKPLLAAMNELKKGLTADDLPRTNPKHIISTIDGMKPVMANLDNLWIKKELNSIKHSLMDSVPLFKQAENRYRELSVPINRMDIGKKLIDDVSPIIGDAEGVTKFLRSLDNARKTIKDSTGAPRYDSLGDILLPDQMKVLSKVRSEFDMGKRMSTNAVRGSKSMKAKIGDALRPEEAPPMLSTKMMVIRKIMSRMKGHATEKTLDYLSERQFNPKEWAAIMKEATPDEAAMINASQHGGRALVSEALFQSGRQENNK